MNFIKYLQEIYKQCLQDYGKGKRGDKQRKFPVLDCKFFLRLLSFAFLNIISARDSTSRSVKVCCLSE